MDLTLHSHGPPELPALPGVTFQLHLSEPNKRPLGSPSISFFPSTPSYSLLCGSRVPLLHSEALHGHICYGDKLSAVNVSLPHSLPYPSRQPHEPLKLGVCFTPHRAHHMVHARGTSAKLGLQIHLIFCQKSLLFYTRDICFPGQDGEMTQSIRCVCWEARQTSQCPKSDFLRHRKALECHLPFCKDSTREQKHMLSSYRVL